MIFNQETFSCYMAFKKELKNKLGTNLQIRLLETITNAIIYNISGCAQSDIQYTDLAITCI